ncbi:MAG: hypothetical protein HOL66_16415 [Rhodospirillaceae bacterium]|nr:hypothetical protein [Rhodospirillaceae bacterium]MBT6406453.1 hypothetical protein [Rhodospirillaceae bacterium]
MKSDFWDLILELFYDEDKEGFTLNYLDNYIYNLNNTEIKPYYFLFVVSGALIFAAKMLFSAIASIYGGLFGNIEVNGDYVVQNSYVPLIGIVILIAFSLHFLLVVYLAPFVIVKCKGHIAVPKGEFALSSQVYGWGIYSFLLYPIALIHALILPPKEKSLR